MDEVFVKARTRSLLEHFAAITDARPQWKVAYPLPEILLLVVSATIASCDDYDDIVAWGEAHLDFLRRLVELGGSISVPDGVVNQELIELIEADYVLEGDGGSGRTYYKITNAGRAAIKLSLGQ